MKYILVNLGVPIELEIGSEAVKLEDEVNSFFLITNKYYYYYLKKKTSLSLCCANARAANLRYADGI